jgi:alpha-amylase
MARNLVLYTVVHQPRRIKLPAQPIPKGASIEDITHCLFDERMNERYFHKVAQKCYYPATESFLDLVRQGLKLSIGFSVSFLRQAEAWDRQLLQRFKTLVAEPNVELVGVEPYHSFLFLYDQPLFIQRMRWMREEMERVFGKTPTVTDTTEMCMSPVIYDGLEQAGFRGSFLDGRPWVMDWRESTHLYHASGKLKLLPRHLSLSDDVGYRFSNRTWSGWPLRAETYAHWLREAWGDFVFIGWDYETFGEHQWRDTGIFEFMRRLPEELTVRGAQTRTPSEIIDELGDHSFHLPLPGFPSTWAGSGGMEFFLGNSAQQAIFQLMLQVHGMARLSENPELLDLALWLGQSDNLHLIQWFGRGGSEAEVSAYFTPREWWDLGPTGIIYEQQQVYLNFLRAMEPFLPGRKAPTPFALPLFNGRELQLAEPGFEARY